MYTVNLDYCNVTQRDSGSHAVRRIKIPFAVFQNHWRHFEKLVHSELPTLHIGEFTILQVDAADGIADVHKIVEILLSLSLPFEYLV